MKTLTRDDTHHGQEYVLKSEADAEIARARAGALEEAVKVCEAHYNHEAKDIAEEIRALAAGVR